MNNRMPEDKGLDKTITLLREGYDFIINRSRDFDSNIFETTLLGEKAICLTGSRAAELFYDTHRFRREDAAPSRVEKTLFGEGGVQGMDGEAHRHRKAMFMNLMNDSAMAEIEALTGKYWNEYFKDVDSQATIELYEAAKVVLLKVACEWTGMPLEEDRDTIEARAREISDLYESPAAIGLQHFKGRHSRSKAEDWAASVVQDVRDGKLEADEDRALYQFSWHRDLDGNLLDTETVAVELLNLIRPINANSVWVSMIGLALHEHPDKMEELNSIEPMELEWFIQEVRRYYPFFPFTVARVSTDFDWGDYRFEEGTLTLLDLYGTNHHPNDWVSPDEFKPLRFKGWQQTPFNFIPQGGGSYDFGHRCAGEFITVAVMQKTLDVLMNQISYDVPEQDFGFEFNDVPPVVNDKFKVSGVKVQ